MDNFELPNLVSRTELGICRTTNFCELESFKRLLSAYFLSIPPDSIQPENQTQPYMTTAVAFGFDVMILPISLEQNGTGVGGFNYSALKNNTNPFILMIHSPYELPTKKTQTFYVSAVENDIYFITPQLEKIDDSMIGMDPHE